MDGDSEHVTGWWQLALGPKSIPAIEASKETTMEGHAALLGTRPLCSTASWTFPSEHFKSPQIFTASMNGLSVLGAAKPEA